MIKTDIFERIFEELIENDLINLQDFQDCEIDSAKKAVLEIMEEAFKDILVIQGEVLQ